MRVRGFSLLELLVVMGLFALAVGMTFVSLGRQPDAARTIGLTQEVVEALRAARHQARASQVPVALCFPSNGGTTPVASGYYLMVGEDAPLAQTARRFDGEYKHARVFCGRWKAPDAGPPAVDIKAENFDLTAWLGAAPTDAVIAFLPSGAAVSNLPVQDGSYGLLVGEDFDFAGNDPSTAVATAGMHVRTIRINPLGEVSLALAPPPEVAVGAAATVPGANPPPPGLAGAATPTIGGITPVPDFSDGIYPTGVTGGVSVGDYVTFQVTAQDPDGGPLFSSWTGPGNFSSASEGRMEFGGGQWRADWVWTPPDTATPGQQFDLVCTVRDEQGHSVSSNASLSPRMLVSSPARLLVEDRSSPQWAYLQLTEEGHMVKRIPSPYESPAPANFLPDGGSYIHTGSNGYGLDPTLRITQSSGSYRDIGTGWYARASWDGSRVVYLTYGPDTIHWCDLNGALKGSVGTSLGTYPDIWGDGVVLKDVAGIIFIPTTTLVPQTLDSTALVGAARFSPDGRLIVYPRENDVYVVGNPALGVTQPPTKLTSLGDVSFGDAEVVWSPDGTQLAFFREPTFNRTLWSGRLDNPTTPTSLVNLRQVSNRDFGFAMGISWKD
ncbi:MAG: PD40 domain-containing protein [Candidatus Eremiobacteraeota bacterium]|nr:PD40 domain-containing protein [Candidatus Eremiobacteraeota bacterium]